MTAKARLVNREEQRKLIDEILDAIAGSAQTSPSKDIDHRILEMYGLAGVGKSRILDAVKEACRSRAMPFVVVDLLPYMSANSASSLAHILSEICGQLDHYFPDMASVRSHLLPLAAGTPGNNLTSQKNLDDEVSRKLPLIRNELASILVGHNKPLIILLDSTEYCPTALFDKIGKEILSKITVEHPALSFAVFAAGRGAKIIDSDWPSKLREMTNAIRLDPLDRIFTVEHIACLPPNGQYQSAADDIYSVSNGHPYSTEALVKSLHKLKIHVSQVGSQKNDLARLLYEEVVKTYVLAGTDPWVLEFVLKASVFRSFDAAILRQVMDSDRTLNWYIQRMIEMQAPPLHLVDYDKNSEPAYYLEPTLAGLLRTTQAILEPEMTAALHDQARGIWQQMLKERVSPRAATEILYHAVQAATIRNIDPNLGAKRLLEQLLITHFKPVERVRELHELRDFIARDRGLEDLLDKICMEDLAQLIIRHLKSSQSGSQTHQVTHLIIDYHPPDEYTVTWHALDQVLLPKKTIRTPRRYSLDDWQKDLEKTGRAAFSTFLPREAQVFIQERNDWIIQISTDCVDIPWEILHDGTEFICLSHSTARKPKQVKQPLRSQSQRTNRALVIGNPTGDLKGAEREALEVAKLLETHGMEVETLIGPDRATTVEFQKLITGEAYDLIHFAGHGEYHHAAPNLSAISFKDSPYYAEELERSLLGTPFVFLSACTGGLSTSKDLMAGCRDRFMEGMAAAALVCGAIGCLGPLWEIDDGAARLFALVFYRELLKGQPLGESVRQARLATRTLSPDFWAAWVLYGDPLRKLT